MSAETDRLIRCFQAVFPDLNEREATRASTANLGAWDSVATTNLVAVIEEEFGTQFDPREIEKLDSFQKFVTKLKIPA
jgi:acyl carrier protein